MRFAAGPLRYIAAESVRSGRSLGRGAVYLFVLGVIAMVSIGLALAARRADRRSELNRWSRATKYLNDICPPADDTAIPWCRVLDADGNTGAGEVAASDRMASLGAVAPRETPREIPTQTAMPTRRSGADAA